jgi:hypothetical protein
MSTRFRTGSRVAKAYTLLLALTCPPVFRRRFGRDMTETFVAEWGAARAQGSFATWTCAAMAVWDALRLGAAAYVSAAADVHPAVPRLLRRPLAFVLVSVLVGGCLGLASAILHVVALVMQPALGVTNPEQLVAIYRVDPLSQREESLSLRDLQRLQADAAPLQNVAGYLRMPVDISAPGSTRTVTAEIVSERYFSTLGVHGVADLQEPGQALLSSRLARQRDGLRYRRHGARSLHRDQLRLASHSGRLAKYQQPPCAAPWFCAAPAGEARDLTDAGVGRTHPHATNIAASGDGYRGCAGKFRDDGGRAVHLSSGSAVRGHDTSNAASAAHPHDVAPDRRRDPRHSSGGEHTRGLRTGDGA